MPNITQQMEALEPDENGTTDKHKLDTIYTKGKSRLSKEAKQKGSVKDKIPVVIDDRTTVYISDESKRDEVFEKYYKHIYGRNYKEDAFTFIDDKKNNNDQRTDTGHSTPETEKP